MGFFIWDNIHGIKIVHREGEFDMHFGKLGIKAYFMIVISGMEWNQ